MVGPDDTKNRLIDAAGEIFARDGFRGATVRDICTAASANVAAINYHFGDKAGLYRAVFDYAFTCACSPGIEDAKADPGERLQAWVTGFLHRILDRGKPAWHGQLMAREMSEPSDVLDVMVEQHIRPHFEMLAAIVRDLAPTATPPAVRRLASSVVAQCVFYHHCKPVIARLHPDWRFTTEEVDALAQHIAGFSLAGIRSSLSEASPPAER